jgi:hypothetical protein
MVCLSSGVDKQPLAAGSNPTARANSGQSGSSFAMQSLAHLDGVGAQEAGPSNRSCFGTEMGGLMDYMAWVESIPLAASAAKDTRQIESRKSLAGPLAGASGSTQAAGSKSMGKQCSLRFGRWQEGVLVNDGKHLQPCAKPSGPLAHGRACVML